MGTDDFYNISDVYGLDFKILANCFKAFASYLDIPKKEWNKYHAPYKDTVNCVPARNIEKVPCTLQRYYLLSTTNFDFIVDKIKIDYSH
jgi:hypothetical protein